MKNLTISLDEETLTETRVRAAKEGKSVSRYVGDLLRANVAAAEPASRRDRASQREALERILSGPKWSIMRDGRMPTADERNER